MAAFQRTGWRRVLRVGGYFLVACFLAFPCGASPRGHGKHSPVDLPRPDHVVIVVMENKSFSDIIGNPEAPYINSLAKEGALLSRSYGVTHPSQPNYLALFSGSTQGVEDDSCPHTFTGQNLGRELISAGLSFGTYSESMPSLGYTGCVHGRYYRKHNPAVNWQGIDIPPFTNMPFTSFPSDYGQLPTISLVIPDIVNDMHDGSIATGDTWLRDHLDPYVRWARIHNSLLILTWDEGRSFLWFFGNNHIPTILAGEMVHPGDYDRRVDHYDMLRTLLDMYGLAPMGKSADAKPITEIWQ
jgi:phospholipase C